MNFPGKKGKGIQKEDHVQRLEVESMTRPWRDLWDGPEKCIIERDGIYCGTLFGRQ